MDIFKSIKDGTFWVSAYHHLNKRKLTVKESDNLIGLYLRLICYEKVHKKYSYVLENHQPSKPEDKHFSNKIFTCWMQGLDNAPPLVKKCISTMQERFPEREVIVITEDNLTDYIDIPDWFLEKWRKGIIDNTKLSNLIRMELLIKYGGIWMDATVFCSSSTLPGYIDNSPLFMYKERGLGEIRCGATWLMSAESNNNILRATRDVYLEYWKYENSLIEYFIITFCIKMATEKYPEEWDAVFLAPATTQGVLGQYLFKPFDRQIWENIKSLTCIHKLSYKEAEGKYETDGTFYKALLNGELDR